MKTTGLMLGAVILSGCAAVPLSPDGTAKIEVRTEEIACRL